MAASGVMRLRRRVGISDRFLLTSPPKRWRAACASAVRKKKRWRDLIQHSCFFFLLFVLLTCDSLTHHLPGLVGL